jgi:hypothetical protein
MAEAQSTPSNGKTATPADVEKYANNWPSIDTVCKQLHMSFVRVQEFMREGHLTTVKVRGQTRFNPKEVDALAETLAEIPGDDEAEDRRASRAGMPAEAVRATAELVRQMGTQVAEMHRLCMDLHRLNMESWDKANDAQDRAFTRVLDRCTKYEKVIDDYLDAREEQFSQALLRDMAMKSNDAKLVRRQQMWEATKSQMTRLVDVAVQRFSLGVDEGTMKKMKLAAEMFKSLSRTHLQLLLDQEGFLDDKQKELLRELLKMEDAEIAARAAARAAAEQTTAESKTAESTADSNPADTTAESTPADPPPPPAQESAAKQESESNNA